LRFHSAHVDAKGSAAGAIPPAVAARFDGSALMDAADGRQRVPFSGTLRYRDRALTADVQATGLSGSLSAALRRAARWCAAWVHAALHQPGVDPP
jgi:CTP:molybdopterin cytidylyltransferase MocA